MKKIQLTRAGYENLLKELEMLFRVERPRVVQEILEDTPDWGFEAGPDFQRILDRRRWVDQQYIQYLMLLIQMLLMVSRRIKLIANYSKTGGNATLQFRLVIGGTILTFTSQPMGGAAITNDTYIFTIDLNFRAANGLFASAFYTRYHPNAQENEVVKTTITDIWC